MLRIVVEVLVVVLEEVVVVVDVLVDVVEVDVIVEVVVVDVVDVVVVVTETLFLNPGVPLHILLEFHPLLSLSSVSPSPSAPQELE